MTRFVADTSVIVKLFLAEVHSDAAERLIRGSHELHAPAHAPAEFANTLWKHARLGRLADDEVTDALHRYQRLGIGLHDLEHLIAEAMRLALRHDRTIYDALYVVLAQRLDAQFVTADRRLYNALAEELPETMLWVEDLPEEEDDDEQ
jgi:predicted nucleic acid-binding protein